MADVPAMTAPNRTFDSMSRSSNRSTPVEKAQLSSPS
jgi:hypothetical protein